MLDFNEASSSLESKLNRRSSCFYPASGDRFATRVGSPNTRRKGSRPGGRLLPELFGGDCDDKTMVADDVGPVITGGAVGRGPAAGPDPVRELHRDRCQ